MPNPEMRDIAKFFYEVGQLKRVQRSGWWVAGIDNPESVADHSLRTAIIGYILATLEKADPMKTAVMCLFHDVPEARLNDHHRIVSRYINKDDADERAFHDQTRRLPDDLAQELVALLASFERGDSLEARIARDADRLECLIQAREYQAQGYKDVTDWLESNQASLTTDSAKRIALECLRTEPSEWWQGLKSLKPK